MSLIQPDEVDYYKRLGYRVDERVGRGRMELFAQKSLAGVRGGVLFVVDANGNPVAQLATKDPQPAEAVYTTIDYDLQLALQRSNALSAGMSGAIVRLGAGYRQGVGDGLFAAINPNLFEPANYNSSQLISNLFTDATPLLNRAN